MISSLVLNASIYIHCVGSKILHINVQKLDSKVINPIFHFHLKWGRTQWFKRTILSQMKDQNHILKKRQKTSNSTSLNNTKHENRY